MLSNLPALGNVCRSRFSIRRTRGIRKTSVTLAGWPTLLDLLRLGPRDAWRVHVSGIDPVHADAGFFKFRCPGLRHSFEAELGNSYAPQPGNDLAGVARHVDDAIRRVPSLPATRFLIKRNGPIKLVVSTSRENLEPVIEQVRHRRRPDGGCVVHQNVETPFELARASSRRCARLSRGLLTSASMTTMLSRRSSAKAGRLMPVRLGPSFKNFIAHFVQLITCRATNDNPAAPSRGKRSSHRAAKPCEAR